MAFGDNRMKFLVLCTLAGLLAAVLIIWFFAARTFATPHLTVAFLDVGQGDAIFIESPTGTQVLIDGGKGSRVLTQLPRVMSFFDRSLDMIIGTHPDADHIGGLVGVLERYDISYVVQSSVLGDTSIWEELQKMANEEGAERVEAQRGQIFDIGGGAYIEVLFPDRPIPNAETNLASIVARLVYGETAFLLTGDSPQSIEEYLVYLDRERLESNVLKIGHHGSKTSSSPLYVGYVSPESTVLSYGCGNSYGHPNTEVLETINNFNLEIRDTCKEGSVVYESDGESVVKK